MKFSFENNFRFKKVLTFATIVLPIHQSNFGIERVSALVDKKKQEGLERERVGMDGTIPSIMALQMEQLEECSMCYNLVITVFHDSDLSCYFWMLIRLSF